MRQVTFLLFVVPNAEKLFRIDGALSLVNELTVQTGYVSRSVTGVVGFFSGSPSFCLSSLLFV
jgi:hypothetical protein